MLRPGLLLWVFLLIAPTLLARGDASSPAPGAAVLAETEAFEKTIRPILIEHCHGCHGPKKQQSGLRLDVREAALKGGDAGPLLVAGKPKESLLWQRIQPDAEKRMPPKQSLTPKQIEAIETWIAKGAHWPASTATGSASAGPAKELWSLKPLLSTAKSPPAGPAGKSGIDELIDSGLVQGGLQRAAPADKRTLLRRLALVLTGLPPRPEWVEALEKDQRPDAWERSIDQLLEGDAHAERWARHWMDVARYADTKGYVFFQDGNYPWSHTYRDWLIGAFRADMPYDRFVRMQIAADRLLASGDAKLEDLPALGFLSLGGRFMNNQHDIIDDRIDVVTRGLLGLTVSCARCHDHKFDPIPTADYYSLYGVFAASVEPEVPPMFTAAPNTNEFRAFERELQERERKFEEHIQARYQSMIRRARNDLASHLLAVRELRGKPAQDEFMLIADPNDINPTLLKRWRAWLDSPTRKTDPAWSAWTEIEGFENDRFPERLKTKVESPSWASVPEPIRNAFAATKPANINEAARAYAAAFTNPFRGRQPDLDPSWNDPKSPWNTANDAFTDLELFPDREGQGVLQTLRKQVEEWRISGKGAPARAHALVDVKDPRAARVFLRGNPLRLGVEVPRQIPASLGTTEPIRSGSGRLELAQAITRPDRPLLARVWVNRVWMICFGQGLVRTPGDFGSRGEKPTHPELLDRLAGELMADGWSTRKLLRKILTSATWKAASFDPVSEQKDPENRLWARQNPRRLDFEALRDSMLAVSGRADAKVGGPSVKDMQSQRRTLYLHLDRLSVPGLFRTFDFPSPDATSSMRDQTTTPLQALWLMNHPFAASCAGALAKKAEAAIAKPDNAGTAEPDVNARAWVISLYRLAYQRAPEMVELETMMTFLRAQGAEGRLKAAQALLASNEFSFVD